jgi:hypothetical protein
MGKIQSSVKFAIHPGKLDAFKEAANALCDTVKEKVRKRRIRVLKESRYNGRLSHLSSKSASTTKLGSLHAAFIRTPFRRSSETAPKWALGSKEL